MFMNGRWNVIGLVIDEFVVDGSYSSKGSTFPAEYRGSTNPYNCNDYLLGFRLALYVE